MFRSPSRWFSFHEIVDKHGFVVFQEQVCILHVFNVFCFGLVAYGVGAQLKDTSPGNQIWDRGSSRCLKIQKTLQCKRCLRGYTPNEWRCCFIFVIQGHPNTTVSIIASEYGQDSCNYLELLDYLILILGSCWDHFFNINRPPESYKMSAKNA